MAKLAIAVGMSMAAPSVAPAATLATQVAMVIALSTSACLKVQSRSPSASFASVTP